MVLHLILLSRWHYPVEDLEEAIPKDDAGPRRVTKLIKTYHRTIEEQSRETDQDARKIGTNSCAGTESMFAARSLHSYRLPRAAESYALHYDGRLRVLDGVYSCNSGMLSKTDDSISSQKQV